MLLKIPFYENKGGNRCLQASMQSVLKHFLDKECTLEELDKLTQRKEGYWTWTTQGVTVLYDLGLDLRYYSKGDLEPFLEGETFIRRYYGKDAGKILKYTDLPVTIESIKKLIKSIVFLRRESYP